MAYPLLQGIRNQALLAAFGQFLAAAWTAFKCICEFHCTVYVTYCAAHPLCRFSTVPSHLKSFLSFSSPLFFVSLLHCFLCEKTNTVLANHNNAFFLAYINTNLYIVQSLRVVYLLTRIMLENELIFIVLVVLCLVYSYIIVTSEPQTPMGHDFVLLRYITCASAHASDIIIVFV